MFISVYLCMHLHICVCVCVYVCVLVAQSCCLFVTSWTVAHQIPLSLEFSRQEYWSGLLFLSPGDLPEPGIEPGSPTLPADFLLSGPPGKPEPHQNQDRHSLKITGLVRNVSPDFCVPTSVFPTLPTIPEA